MVPRLVQPGQEFLDNVDAVQGDEVFEPVRRRERVLVRQVGYFAGKGRGGEVVPDRDVEGAGPGVGVVGVRGGCDEQARRRGQVLDRDDKLEAALVVAVLELEVAVLLEPVAVRLGGVEGAKVELRVDGVRQEGERLDGRLERRVVVVAGEGACAFEQAVCAQWVRHALLGSALLSRDESRRERKTSAHESGAPIHLTVCNAEYKNSEYNEVAFSRQSSAPQPSSIPP